MPKKNNLNLQDFGPVTSFSTSIISGLLIGLLIQYFIGYEPVPVIIFVLIVSIGLYSAVGTCFKAAACIT